MVLASSPAAARAEASKSLLLMSFPVVRSLMPQTTRWGEPAAFGSFLQLEVKCRPVIICGCEIDSSSSSRLAADSPAPGAVAAPAPPAEQLLKSIAKKHRVKKFKLAEHRVCRIVISPFGRVTH